MLLDDSKRVDIQQVFALLGEQTIKIRLLEVELQAARDTIKQLSESKQ